MYNQIINIRSNIMKVDFNTVKNSVKNALVKYCGVEEGEADGMIYGQDGLDKIMNDMFNLPPQIEANVYGLHIGEHEFDLCVSVDNDEPHSSMCLLQFGECIDIDGASTLFAPMLTVMTSASVSSGAKPCARFSKSPPLVRPLMP